MDRGGQAPQSQRFEAGSMCGQRNGEASFNLKAAPALGLDVPRKLRAFADELIESVVDRFWPTTSLPTSAPRRMESVAIGGRADVSRASFVDAHPLY
jgi:hypothetical protein